MKKIFIDKYSYLYVFFIILFTSLVYMNSLKNDYNMDDSLVMTNNKLVNGNFTEIFTNHSFSDDGYDFEYRPISIATFYLENKFFGKNPNVSHFISILLYVFLSILIYYFLLIIDIDVTSALILSLLFVSYPLHTEVVDNIKNRDELLVSIFGFSALIIALKSLTKPRWLFLVLLVVFSFFGMLSKSSFLIFPVIIALIIAVYTQKQSNFYRAKLFFKYLTFSGLGILAVIILKYFVFKNSHAIRLFEYFENPLYFSSFQERIFPSFYIIGYYIKLMLNPFTPIYYYGYNTINYTDVFSFYSLIGILFVIIIPFLVYKLLKNNTNDALPLTIGLGILYINLIAVSNLPKPLPGIVAERFIFIATLGFLLVLFFSLKLICKKFFSNYLTNFTFAISCILVCIFSITTFARNKQWKNELTLYKNDIHRVPNSAKANEMLANKYLTLAISENNKTLLSLSEQYFQKAILIYPDHSACLNNLGYINFIKTDYSKALDYYQKSVQLSNKPLVYFNIAKCYEKLNKIDLCNKAYQQAFYIDPNLNQLILSYKQFVISNNLLTESIRYLEDTILLKHKNNLNTHLLLIDLYNENKNYSGMLIHLKKVYELTKDEKYQQYINLIENNANFEATNHK